MKQFFAFVKKEFYHIWRDRRTMFILLGMPVVQIIIFGFALTNEVKNESIAILDQSKDAAATQLISEISASRYFNVAATLHSPDEIAETFKTNKAKLILVLPASFGSCLLYTSDAADERS